MLNTKNKPEPPRTEREKEKRKNMHKVTGLTSFVNRRLEGGWKRGGVCSAHLIIGWCFLCVFQTFTHTHAHKHTYTINKHTQHTCTLTLAYTDTYF